MLPGLLCIAASAARAEVPASGVAQFNAAYAEVKALIPQDQAHGAMPKFANPAERAALERLCDSKAILGAPPYTAKSVSDLLDMLPEESELVTAYVFFSPNHSGTVNGALLVEYQDEVIRLFVLSIDTFGAVMPALTDLVPRLPPDKVNEFGRAAVRQMRGGFRQMVEGLTQMLTSNALRQDNQILLATSFRNAGVPVAGAMTPADRAAIIQNVQAALPKLSPQVQAPLRDFAAAMANPDCEGLCKME
jgi:hypothetical protein